MNQGESDTSAGPASATYRSGGDGSGGPRVDLARLWLRLVAGTAQIAASYCSDRYCHLVLDMPRHQAPRRVPLPGDVATLERILQGESQKTIACETTCAPSTVSFKATRCLKAMGVECKTGAIPTALIMMAQSSKRGLSAIGAETSMLPRDGYSRHLVRIPRPDTFAGGIFSPAERDIVELLIEGKTRQEIGELRKTSLRTVANQLGQAYRKFGVSGRIALIGRLIERGNSFDGVVLPSWPNGSSNETRAGSDRDTTG